MNCRKTLDKIFLSILLAIFVLSPATFSQNRIELSISSGYQMLGTIDAYYNPGFEGEFDINDAAFFSAVFGYKVEREIIFEVQYLYQPTKTSFKYTGSAEIAFPAISDDINVHYIMLGALYEKPFSKSATGYGGLLIGTSGIVPVKDYESEWRLAFGITLGAKFLVSDNIGIKIQTQGLFPIQWGSGSIYIGPNGEGYSVTSGTLITQVNVGGGLFYTF
jgi:opacity protein-like surface antigen